MTIYENPDWLALKAGIIGDPDNDLRRLVAADWLEEQGEADRAEFIRLQVELTAPCDPWCRGRVVQESITRAVPCAKCGPVWLREKELFEAHHSEWFGGLRAGLSLTPAPFGDSRDVDPWVAIRRGFVAELHVPAAWVWGGACRRCDETNTACPDCKGTGYTPAHGYEVIRSHPVTRVVVTNRYPLQMNGGWQWLRQPEYEHSSTVPDSVFDALPGGSRRLYSIVAYPDRQHALAALSAAVINAARSTTSQQEAKS